MNTDYRVIDMDTYYRKDVFRHFSQDCKASTSITHRIDVTELVNFSKRTGTKFYINFLYVLAKALKAVRTTDSVGIGKISSYSPTTRSILPSIFFMKILKLLR